MTAYTDTSLNGSLGCQEERMLADDCFGLQPDVSLRLTVIPFGDMTLLVWLRDEVGSSDFPDILPEFDHLLASIEFLDASERTEATAPDGTSATSSSTPAVETESTVPGCVPQCRTGRLVRPGPLPAGRYTTVNFFAGALAVTVDDGWESNEDSTGEFELRRADGRDLGLARRLSRQGMCRDTGVSPQRSTELALTKLNPARRHSWIGCSEPEPDGRGR